MTRTTEEAAKLVVIRYDHDGREVDRFHFHAPLPAFCDIANTLDYCRQAGTEPFVEEKVAKPAVAAKK